LNLRNLVIFCLMAWAVLAFVSTAFGLEIPGGVILILFLFGVVFLGLYHVGAGILSWGLKCATRAVLKERANQTVKQFNSQQETKYEQYQSHTHTRGVA